MQFAVIESVAERCKVAREHVTVVEIKDGSIIAEFEIQVAAAMVDSMATNLNSMRNSANSGSDCQCICENCILAH